jgi:hypothetical protein
VGSLGTTASFVAVMAASLVTAQVLMMIVSAVSPSRTPHAPPPIVGAHSLDGKRLACKFSFAYTTNQIVANAQTAR